MADKRELLDQVFEAVARYIDGERSRVSPDADAIAALHQFRELSLDAPVSAGAIVALIDELGSPAAMSSTGGRYFGFVNGGVEPAGLAASILASAWDQNVALPAMSPAASYLDGLAAEWMLDVLGLPPSATATFCAGATVANITAAVTARDALLLRQGWSVSEKGLSGAPPIAVVTSEEAHVSVLKALRIAGIGTDAVRAVPTDECGRLRADLVPETAGLTLFMLQAGNVNTGHSDPFAEIVPTLDRERTWVHVDGAFGLWANATPARRASVAGVELADSWATDGHKWLNAPYDCGVAIFADGDALHRSMAMGAAYVPTTDGERSLMNMGLQMSQQARAVPVFAILASLGRQGVADAVERCCVHAERFAAGLSSAGADVLAPVVINQVLVAFGDDDATDAVVARVQGSGSCWMGATTWHGRRAMRISVSDTSTTADDVDASVAVIQTAWDEVRTGRE